MPKLELSVKFRFSTMRLVSRDFAYLVFIICEVCVCGGGGGGGGDTGTFMKVPVSLPVVLVSLKYRYVAYAPLGLEQSGP